MHIRRLQAADLADYRTLRRQALLESPSAFSATPQTEQAVTDAQLLARFDSTPGQAMWGAWEGGRLCATLGMYREQNAKLAHKATLFAMYVAPGARGRGIAGRLLQAAIEHGRSLFDDRLRGRSLTSINVWVFVGVGVTQPVSGFIMESFMPAGATTGALPEEAYRALFTYLAVLVLAGVSAYALFARYRRS